MMWGFILIGILIAIVLDTLLNWIVYDLLVQIESENFQINWVNDGKPIGMFFTPKNSSLFTGAIRRNQILSRWIFKKPNWIVKDKRAGTLYNIFRITGFIQLVLSVSLVAFFVVIFLIQP